MPIIGGTNYPNYQATQTPIYTGPVYQQPNTTPQPNTSIAWVRGETEAYAFPVAAGTSVLLMDRDSMALYSKTVDMSGRLSMEIYDLVKRETKVETNATSGVDMEGYAKVEDVEKLVAEAVNKAMQKKGQYKQHHNKERKEDL